MIDQADIPAVEEQLGGVASAVHRHWSRTSRAAVDDLIDEIDAEDKRGEGVRAEHLLLLLLLFLRRRTSEPFAETTRTRISRAAASIYSAGARSIGVGGPSLNPRSAGNQAADDVLFLSRARIDSDRMSARLSTSVRSFVEGRARIAYRTPALSTVPDVARQPNLLTGANGAQTPPKLLPAPPSGGPNLLPAPPETPPIIPPAPPEPVKKSPDLVGLREDLDRVLADPSGALSKAIVDSWGYRIYNIGIFDAADAAGVTALVAINPMDDRTTPFCRWVHGRVIRMDRARRQVREFRAAVAAEDREGVIRAWRFISMSKAGMRRAKADIAQDRAPGARIRDSEVFARYFASVGLPPYHWYCRTRVTSRASEKRPKKKSAASLWQESRPCVQANFWWAPNSTARIVSMQSRGLFFLICALSIRGFRERDIRRIVAARRPFPELAIGTPKDPPERPHARPHHPTPEPRFRRVTDCHRVAKDRVRLRARRDLLSIKPVVDRRGLFGPVPENEIDDRQSRDRRAVGRESDRDRDRLSETRALESERAIDDANAVEPPIGREGGGEGVFHLTGCDSAPFAVPINFSTPCAISASAGVVTGGSFPTIESIFNSW